VFWQSVVTQRCNDVATDACHAGPCYVCKSTRHGSKKTVGVSCQPQSLRACGKKVVDMGNKNSFPFVEITEFNDAVHVYTAAEVAELNTSENLTNALKESARQILNETFDSGRQLLVCSQSAPSLFVQALTARVPANLYQRENVWWVVPSSKRGGDYEVRFQLWVYRVAYTTCAANKFISYYKDVNGSDSFPSQEFKMAIRRAKNCLYQQQSRAKRGCPSEVGDVGLPLMST
jgi:hypothetical protein